jgi:hypothetical protein
VDQEVAKTLGELELKLQELERELTSIGRHDAPARSSPPPGKLIDEAVERVESGSGATQGVERKVTESGNDAARGIDEQLSDEDEALGGPPVFGGEEIPAQAGATIERDWTVEARETAYGEIPTPPSPPTPPGIPPSPSLSPETPPSGTPSSPDTPPRSGTPPPPGAAPAIPPGVVPPSTPPGAISPSTSPNVVPPSTFPNVVPPSTPPGVVAPSTPRGLDPRYPAAVEESRSLDLAELMRFREKLSSTMDALIDEYSRLLSIEPPPRSRRGA